MRRALGARRRDIRRQFLLEAALLSADRRRRRRGARRAHRDGRQPGFPGAGEALLHHRRNRRRDSHRSDRGAGSPPIRRASSLRSKPCATSERQALKRHVRDLQPPPPRLRRERAFCAPRRADAQASRGADRARDRRRSRDSHRDGVDRHRLQQQHGPATFRASGRRSCSSRSSKRGSGRDIATPRSGGARIFTTKTRLRSRSRSPKCARCRRSATSGTRT